MRLGKKIVLFLSLLTSCIVFSLPQKAHATHYMGVDITYECIGACTIRVYLRLYRDCSGSSSSSPSTDFDLITPAGCIAPTALGPWSARVTTEVTPVCPGAATCCSGPCTPSTIRGV